MSTFYLFQCQVCKGQKLISKPSWVAGDLSEWTTSDATLYPCPICDGTGKVWHQNTKTSREGNVWQR